MKPSDCVCGARYDEFRTGLSFADVRAMMRSASDNPADWRQKRRNSVLGFWHELKLMMWEQAHGACRERYECERAA